jgi:hypothetical protein
MLTRIRRTCHVFLLLYRWEIAFPVQGQPYDATCHPFLRNATVI